MQTMNNTDYIKTVKIQGDGWLVNGSMSVPNEPANRHYTDIQEWLKTNTATPEFTTAEKLANAKTAKQSEIAQAFNSVVKAITTALPHEMVSWRKQEDEARAYTADNTVATPFIDAQLTTRAIVDETKDILVAKIIANADAYQVAYATVLGTNQNRVKAITDATTVTKVNAIAW